MAKQRANVPKFGNWENEQNDVPYTVYFNNARKNKGGKMINPNENPEMFAHLEPSSLPPPPPKSRGRREEEPIGRGAVRPAPEQRDGDLRQFNTPSGKNGSGQRCARSGRPRTVSSELSFERSPLHPQANAMGRGTGSPAWEGSRSHDIIQGTPSRNQSLQHEKGAGAAAVPRFGEWDENDPQSAENFTHIFNKVREDRNSSEALAGKNATLNHPSYPPRSNHTKQCCFPWW